MTGVWAYTGAFAQLSLAFCFAVQALMVSRRRFGWVDRPYYTRVALGALSALFTVRAVTILAGSPINLVGGGIAVSLAVWQFLEVFHHVTLAWRRSAMNAVQGATFAAPPPSYRPSDLRRPK